IPWNRRKEGNHDAKGTIRPRVGAVPSRPFERCAEDTKQLHCGFLQHRELPYLRRKELAPGVPASPNAPVDSYWHPCWFSLGLTVVNSYSRLMQEATQAAPNPLSILTTVTLEAQLFSMPSSAATPLKLAP